jgi:prepilin-type N-terminal cleavage/methylation domain-containing protein
MRRHCAITTKMRPSRQRRLETRSRGYTLIELMIVVGILGLAGALLVPRLIGQDSMTVQAAVRQLIADLSFAQSDALAHQEYRRVQFYDDGRGYCLIRVDETSYGAAFDPATADYINDPLASAGELGRYVIDFSVDDRFEGVSITDVELDGNEYVVYDPLGGTIRAGGLPGLGGTIVMSDGAHSYEITVAPFTGKLTVTKL